MGPRSHRVVAALAATALSLALAAPASAYQIPTPPQRGSDENLELLQKISRGVATVAKEASAGIVFVSVFKTQTGAPQGFIDPFDFLFPPGSRRPDDRGGQGGPRGPRERREGGLGSGFFFDLSKGYIMTNNHVVQDADEIQLKLANGKTYEGKIVGRDSNTDVAIVQVKDAQFDRRGLTQLSLGDSDKMQVGDFVIALGAPFGLEASLSFGVVSAIGRGNLDITKLGNFIQTDAAINPGNSGGPLLDTSGRVIGLNTAIYSRSGGYNGIGFAVPANMARNIGEALINDGFIRRGYLGVYLQPIDDELRTGLDLPSDVKGGALVAKVADGGPADKSGIESGDVITAVNGKEMALSSEIVNTIGLARPGTTLTLTVYRDGKARQLKTTIDQHPEDAQNGQRQAAAAKVDKDAPFGLRVTANTPNLRKTYRLESKTGAVISDVGDDSPADRAGLRPGDVILKVDGRPIGSVADFNKLVRGKSRVMVWLEREGEFHFQVLKN
jgi:serine protease Do